MKNKLMVLCVLFVVFILMLIPVAHAEQVVETVVEVVVVPVLGTAFGIFACVGSVVGGDSCEEGFVEGYELVNTAFGLIGKDIDEVIQTQNFDLGEETAPLIFDGLNNESFDYIWSNSMDHALYLDRMLKEAHRVLKKGGLAIFECKQHVKSSVTADKFWEAVFWESQEEIIKFFKDLNIWKEVLYNPLKFFVLRATRISILDRPCVVCKK